MKRLWLKFVVIACVILLVVALAVISFNLYQLVYRPMLVDKSAPVIVHLDKSTTAASFIHTLKAQHLIKSERLLLWYIRMKGWSVQLKAGIYQISAGESVHEFFARVVDGDVLNLPFRIIEGTTQYQIGDNLKSAPYLDYHPTDWLAIKDGHASAEGLLLADTYHYDAGSGGKDLLLHANISLRQFLDASWQQRTPGLPYQSAYELLIAASIIEKEASLADEKRLIAGVIINRLRKKMRLQMDSTVIYAFRQDYNGKLTHADMKIDSPYNSYRYSGLPPTPISMVGKDAIEAAAHPQLSNYLFFVSKGDGSHHFSVTYEQQKQAIFRYMKKGK